MSSVKSIFGGLIMKKKRLLSLITAASMLLSMTGITASAESGGKKTVSQMVSEMTTEQKVEQMMMITLRQWSDGETFEKSYKFNDEQISFIQRHNFGGICLFASNVHDTKQTVELTSDIQQAAMKSCGIPMLIAADQEGGSIYRLSTGTPTCGNMALGAANDPELAKENAKIIGSELMSVGFNTNFAPVVDVNNNPSNPVINIRSFSSDPQLVSRMGTGYISGLQSEGVITACKHFPGHGDTNTDSHTGLPLISKSYDELKKLELVPYSEVCKSTDMIMTAHIQFPEIETETYTSKADGSKINLPATLSKKMITDILRTDYGFDGVVVTDSMVMGAIASNFDIVDSAVLAINAGVDIILEPMTIQSSDDIAKMEKYIKDVAKKVDDGTIPVKTVDKAVTRILTMKQQRGILDYTAPSAENALKTVGSAEHREKALQTAQRAVTLVKNDDDLLPLDLGTEGSVAYFYPYENVANTMQFALDRLKKDGVVSEKVSAECSCYQNHTAAEYEDTVKKCDAVIVSLEMYRAANIDKTNARGWQAVFCDDIIELAHKNGKKVVFLSANIPYDTARFTAADAIVAAYNADGMGTLPVDGEENEAYGVNYPAALITILGGNRPTGKLPVDVYAVDENSQYTDRILYPCGYGLTYKIGTDRLAGADRYATAVEISKASFTKAETVVLAYGLNYADALAGVPLASKLDAPILLTNKDTLPEVTLTEIKRLEAKKVIILGGEGAVGTEVEDALTKENITVQRIAGKTRFGTASAIAEKLNETPEDVFFVYYNEFADALSVSTVAALKNAPMIYLTTKGELNADTAAYLAKLKEKNCVKNAYVIGGDGVISDDMASKAAKTLGLEKAERIAGKDRFKTCTAVNERFRDVLSGNTICVATGMDFPDALAGGVFAAKNKAPLLLINGKAKTPSLNDEQKAYLKTKAAGKITAFGGTGVVPDAHITDIAENSK